MKPAILIIEDDPAISNLVRHWMEKHTDGEGSPVNIEQATTLEAGMLLAPKATAIILDLGLPDSPDAHETARKIPELRKYAPVIVLTSYANSERAAESELLEVCVKEYGAEVCVFKTMLDTKGLEWFMLMVQAAMCRRVYAEHAGLYMPAPSLYSGSR
jgi:CheY-like chemotaxis protein